ncbi:adenosylcobinamide-phosphate synthase CbiB [Heyndrickxia oleronia]|jgi:adenosylcobinamide-phosphate synthase|uniref:adenosylcobinamide-phosphate synthase CbiB n=1 Tax=Heyndrickxia oleronia TaxID=38875 RepID=UPI00203C66C5|nr:adenosylcobinamide-phosphate synthase CbiB [Heyndrickxia oleronia]MCI1590567.1 adenosylcobinamide-phosphate synthase CbiB [Heyndrickxia oleronia]MCI1614303.1 adenosylcobinamide-phosphate synthase CbiB [Heyndrickxia oleronia]MCI1745041.1 adenosylcobinamide-phosphate synthase CbiB [Heyndrickxia oleronia]MCI1762125.1 adenosylcobinamide-phosphate synthase CbiB [Heyndrickxia oleronia]MCM3456147.1 adenosylcobinamide-phosphate synthase CbiB [Heyndrickxia oleronia]
MILHHLCALTIAIIIDWFIGDPPKWPHPVKWMGSLISFFTKHLNKGNHRKGRGVFMLSLIVLLTGLIALTITILLHQWHPLAGVIGEALMIATTIAQKGLKDAGLEVYEPLMNKDLPLARTKLSYIVGRDTEQLDESEIVRGTVETIAENTSDGITAPLFWALIGGAPLAMIYRAINTCDSMVGYRNQKYEQFGWASARLDDWVNWIPSRLTGCIILLFCKPVYLNLKPAWKLFLTDAKKHPSPNSGWCEAAVAVILGIQLGGVNYYKGIVSDRARMGQPFEALKAVHIKKTIVIMNSAVLLFALFLWIGGITIDIATSWF